ncbi:hypothetical protein HHA04nite_21950 [Halomonas halophila]|uniref:Uncharacterized protein n=1 Tax=Halomonas halophila TaxID=29573 RepID=A0ABQ0U545_9GAMM|nr:hypothetical protein HHA04nite_21950 [Halomonas halophila]
MFGGGRAIVVHEAPGDCLVAVGERRADIVKGLEADSSRFVWSATIAVSSHSSLGVVSCIRKKNE